LVAEKMGWTIEYMKHLKDFVQTQDLDLKSFSLNAVIKKVPFAHFIIGIESLSQLEQNMNCIRANRFDEENVYNTWWSKLHLYPEKLLNPSLW